MYTSPVFGIPHVQAILALLRIHCDYLHTSSFFSGQEFLKENAFSDPPMLVIKAEVYGPAPEKLLV